jgi:hypothetical protein
MDATCTRTPAMATRAAATGSHSFRTSAILSLAGGWLPPRQATCLLAIDERGEHATAARSLSLVDGASSDSTGCYGCATARHSVSSAIMPPAWAPARVPQGDGLGAPPPIRAAAARPGHHNAIPRSAAPDFGQACLYVGGVQLRDFRGFQPIFAGGL